MKRKIIVSLAIIAFAGIGYIANIVLLPRVKVENLSGQLLQSVEVKLPNTNIVFSDISEGGIHISKHSPKQSDGVYKYDIYFSSGATLRGECGYIKSNEFGKMFLITVRSESEVTCNS